MRDTAVDHPRAGFLRFPDDVVPLTRADIQRISKKPGGRLQCCPISGDNLERSTVDVHRMDKSTVGADETHLESQCLLTVNVTYATYAADSPARTSQASTKISNGWMNTGHSVKEYRRHNFYFVKGFIFSISSCCAAFILRARAFNSTFSPCLMRTSAIFSACW